ncbi:MAG: hypothetical protein H7067_00030 [Burkholderiales bacterium]|nr:hypothetical protein [Opitutaceae bacterium]
MTAALEVRNDVSVKRVVVPTDRLPNRCELYFLVKYGQFEDLERVFTEVRARPVEFYRGYPPLYGLYDQMDGFGHPFSEQQWEDHFSQLAAWSRAYPDSPSPQVSAAGALITYAWAARAEGRGKADASADNVLFTQRLRRARELLLKAEARATQESMIYRTHMIVAMGLGLPRTEMERLLKRGVELGPNDQSLYESATRYLSPWMQGKPGEWEAFAAREADKRGGEDGDILYMVLARSMASSYQGGIFERSRVSWERMRRGFATAGRRSPEYTWDIHSYCYFACLAGDRPIAKALFTHLGDSREPEVWIDEATFTRWKDWAAQGG